MTYGPDFFALQTDEVESLATFYEQILEIPRARQSPPEAVVFDTKPIPFAVRKPLDQRVGVNAAGVGVSMWFNCDDVDALRERIGYSDAKVLTEIVPSPFGRMFSFVDPAGYTVTAHQLPAE